jgi:hypothetical protein
VTRVLMPHLTLSGRPRAISSSQNCDELLAVDGRFLVGEDEEADLVVVDQLLDLVDHLLRVTHPVVAPELPLRAERAGERAAARHVGDGHPHRAGCRCTSPTRGCSSPADRIEVAHRGSGRGGDDLLALLKARPRTFFSDARASGPLAMVPIRLLKISSPSPRTMTSTQGASVSTCWYMKVACTPPSTRDDVGVHLLGDLEHPLGLVDRGRDRGGADHVGAGRPDALAQRVLEVVGHRVDEGDVGEPGLFNEPVR